MPDSRMQLLAKKVINHSVSLQRGEKVMITCTLDTLPLAKAIVREAYAAGGIPFVNFVSEELTGEINRGASKEQIAYIIQKDSWKSVEMDAAINLNVARNEHELDISPKEQQRMVEKWSYEYKIDKGILPTPPRLKWTVLLYPSYPVARAAKMPVDEYENLYFAACLIDYACLAKTMEILRSMMNAANRVHILGEGTNLNFSIEDCAAEISAGTWNMPDGEVLCSPKIDSANGYITYNIPSQQKGLTFENVRFACKDGLIVNATANYTDELNAILDCDNGARRIGEFALGTNPAIHRPTGSILFDEKMSGSFHFTPGQQIARIGNGNNSQLHWDLVHSNLPQYGGGEIWFDSTLIQKDGRFTSKELASLNPSCS